MQYMMYKATDKVTDKADKDNKPVYCKRSQKMVVKANTWSTKSREWEIVQLDRKYWKYWEIPQIWKYWGILEIFKIPQIWEYCANDR